MRNFPTTIWSPVATFLRFSSHCNIVSHFNRLTAYLNRCPWTQLTSLKHSFRGERVETPANGVKQKANKLKIIESVRARNREEENCHWLAFSTIHKLVVPWRKKKLFPGKKRMNRKLFLVARWSIAHFLTHRRERETSAPSNERVSESIGNLQWSKERQRF